PEQRLLATAVRTRRGALPAVDGRSDVYSLGLVLYEALGGELPVPQKGGSEKGVRHLLPERHGRRLARYAPGPFFPAPFLKQPPLKRRSRQVSVGLADIIHKCLAHEPKDRYPDAASLATDLRRHLSDLPLLGDHNRSLAERWRKWRRRRPHALTVAG